MKALFRLGLAGALFLAGAAWGQSATAPHIGYFYPAGGQQGTSFEVLVGGQYLTGVRSAYFSGKGVSAEVLWYVRGVRNLSGEQRKTLSTRLKEEIKEREAGVPITAKRWSVNREKDVNAEERLAGVLPRHPLLDNLDSLTLLELKEVEQLFLVFDPKKQLNPQLADMVLLRVTIAPDAGLEDREVRLATGSGMTNPLYFQVGWMPEVKEAEPNDPTTDPKAAKPEPVAPPVILNGQVKPGDVDRFRLDVKQGQKLVVDARARHLVPFLADAVPGWFQATLALFDSKGNEVAFADDFRFNPDPVLYFEIPETGVYELEIRDAIYRGREDFVYRVCVSEEPFITQAFPLGGQMGLDSEITVSGWNLPPTPLKLDTLPGRGSVREAALAIGKGVTNSIPYAVDSLIEHFEAEPNNALARAQRVLLPQTLNGRIDEPGDIDMFQIKGEAGDEIVAEVVARQLNSPIDSLLRLMDASGNVIAWNDDNETTQGFLRTHLSVQTHFADSYLRATLPAAGAYTVLLADAQGNGGDAYAYRLRLSHPRQDFDLCMTPSSIVLPPGGTLPVWVHAQRQDGFDGPIDISVRFGPEGMGLSGARIPSGQSSVRMTLTAPPKAPLGPVNSRLEGAATIDGRTVKHSVTPAEDMMQAFLWRHLVPCEELMVLVRGSKTRVPPVQLAKESPVQIPEGGTVRVQVRAPKNTNIKGLKLDLNEPPDGVTLEKVTPTDTGLSFLLKADGAARAGLADNLIVEAYTESVNQATKQTRRTFLGVFPAIPFEVVPGAVKAAKVNS